VTDYSGRDGAQLDAASQARRDLEARLTDNVIYFDFDSTDLKGDGAQVVQAFAAYLAANPAARVRLEGHTDERGTREYNVGLGERRSTAVEQALLRAGATPAQLTKLSYGEERPTCRESDESCWAMNRRVEIIRL
jgi:peptidoglycan-associated lipoprotein